MNNLEFKKYNPLKAKEPPLFLHILFISGVVLSALGDWIALGNKGMYLKVSMLFSIGAAIIYLFKEQNIKKLKFCGLFAIFFFIPLAFVLIESFGIWSGKAIESANITRGLQKMLFQSVTIVATLAGAYLFGSKTIDYYFIGLCIGNGLILILEFLNFGPINVLLNMGLYLYRIEIHDITFCMGLFMLYYIFVKPRFGNRWLYIALACFFFFVGLKRISLLSLGASIGLGFILYAINKKAQKWLIILLSILLIILGYLFIVIVTNGTFTQFMLENNIDMAGRDKIYRYMSQYYNLTPSYLGYGFEYTVALLRGMRDSGAQIIHVTGIHNDILKQYIELGFWGYFIWMTFTFLLQPLFYNKNFNSQAMVMCMITNLYAWCTYMTDNTIYYYFMSMTLRMILIAMACRAVEAKESTVLNVNNANKAIQLTDEQINLLIYKKPNL